MNQSQYDMLRRSVSEWNTWRSATSEKIDLRGADLTGAYLADAYLTDAYLTDADLAGAIGITPYKTQPLYALRMSATPVTLFGLVNADGQGIYDGGITYAVGHVVEIADYDTDETHGCGAGINLGTLQWCLKQWSEGYRVLRVTVEPADIVAIPLMSDGKLRVRRCTVVDEIDVAPLLQPTTL